MYFSCDSLHSTLFRGTHGADVLLPIRQLDMQFILLNQYQTPKHLLEALWWLTYQDSLCTADALKEADVSCICDSISLHRCTTAILLW